jgi:putative ABC transport system permease protein
VAAGTRTKEIGIRKVLGASVTSAVALLTRDFIKLVLISTVIAVPLSWRLASEWLENYPYRIEIGWELFALSGSIMLTIALVTTSFQAVKVALANPVDSLKNE